MGASQTELNKLKVLLTELSKMTPDPKVKAQIDSVLQGVKLLDGAIAKVTEDSKKASKGLDDVASRARAENLKEVAGSISTLSDALLSVGKGIIQTTADFEMLEARMLTAAKGNKELRDELMAFAREAASSTPYSVQQVTDAIIKLEAYGFEAKKTFKAVGDLAAAYGKDLSQAVEAVADAQTGELERLKEFTITKQQLIEKAREMFNKEIVNSKGQITDLQAMNEALFTIMEERASGAMGRMMDTYAGAMSNFKDSVEQLQQSLGKEVLPKLTDFVKWAGSVVTAFNNLDEGTKSVLSNLGLFTIAIGGIGGKLVSTVMQIQALKASLEASQIAMLSFAGVAAGIGIAVGVLANSYIDAWRKMEEQKAEKIEAECKKIANGFKELREAIKNLNDTPIDIVLKKSPEQIRSEIDDMDQVIEGYRQKIAERQSGQTFTYQFEENKTSYAGVSDFAGQQIEMKAEDARKYLTKSIEDNRKALETTQKGTQAYLDLKASINDAETALSALDFQLKQTDKSMGKQIDSAEAYQKSLISAEEYREKFLSGKFPEASKPTVGPIDDRETINDSNLKKKIQYYKDDLDHLRSYFSEYKLTYEQQITLKEAINKRKDELNKEEERNEKEHWNTYINDLKVSLSAGEISQKQYNDSIASYLNQNTIELQNNADLKTKIEKEYYSGVNKLQKEQAVEAKKAEKDRIESIKAAWSTFIDEQTVKLNEGAISQKEYMESIKKYQQENMQSIQKVSGLSLDIEKKYSQEVKKLRQEEAAEAKKAAEAKLKAEEEIALEIEALDNDVTRSQLKNIQKKIDKFKDAGVEQVKIEEYTQKAIQNLQQSTQEKFDQQIQNQKDKIEDLAEKIRQIDVKLKENKEKQDKLTSLSSSGGDNSSPIKSIEEAFSTGLGEFTKKMEELKKLEEESQKLQAEKAQAEREQKQAQEKLVKAQDDSKKATEELTAALKENTEALGSSPPAKNPEDKPSETPKDGEPKKYYPGDNVGEKDGEPKKYYPGDNVGEKDSTSKLKPGDPGYIYGSDVGNYGGGNLPGKSTQGQGGNLPSNYTKGGFSTNTSSIANPYAGQFGTGNAPQSPQPSVNPSRSNQGWVRMPEGTVTLADGRSAAPSTAITVMPDSRATSTQKTNLTPTSGNQYGGNTYKTEYNITIDNNKLSANAGLERNIGYIVETAIKYS